MGWLCGKTGRLKTGKEQISRKWRGRRRHASKTKIVMRDCIKRPGKNGRRTENNRKKINRIGDH